MKEGWTYKKLGEVCEILDNKRRPITKSDRKPGVIPYYGATGIQDHVDGFIFDGRYLLIGEDGAKWGKGENSAYIIEGKSWVNNHAHILDFHEEVIDTFARYYLNEKDLTPFVTGAIVPKLTQAALVTISIPVPPLSEQERIVSELDLLTEVIDKQKAQLKELDTLAQSIFYDMFGDPVLNDKGWEVEKLKIVAPQKNYQGCIPNAGGKYWLLNLDKVTPQTGTVIEKMLFDKDDVGNSTITFDTTNVLYSKLRPYLNKVVIPDSIGYGTSEFVPLQPKSDILNRVFLANLLRSKPFVDYISIKVAGAKMPRVSMDVLRDYDVILPPLSLQQSFADKVSAIEQQKAAIGRSIAETQQLFDYTMDKYFG